MNHEDVLSIQPAHKLLRRNGKTISIGNKEFCVLLALARRRGDVVGSRALMAQCWCDRTVDDVNVRMAVHQLRKVLDAERDGESSIINVPGRGYALIEPILIDESDEDSSFDGAWSRRAGRIIGRERDVEQLVKQLKACRFVTITGAGGIGKTTAAMALLDAIGKEASGAVTVVELASVDDGSHVFTALATQLGLLAKADVGQLAGALRSKGGILVLDNCEHVIDVVASLTEVIYREAPDLLILTTSREPLKVSGEWVYRLPLLSLPPDAGLNCEELQAFSAVQLFMERAAQANAGFQVSANDTPLLSQICRRLDGIPLAIELAAARVDAYDLSKLFVLLDDRFNVLNQGRRTALPRHKTLKAMVDWSHDLLNEPERAIFRRASVFPSLFDLDAADAVANWNGVEVGEFIATFESLASKSLVVSSRVREGTAFHLLETMRAYGREALGASGEDLETFRRLAIHILEILRLKQLGAFPPRPLALIETVRTVLSSALLASDDADLGLAVARAALPLFFERALMGECRGWSGKVISAMSDAQRDEREAGAVFRYNAMSTLLGWANTEEARHMLQLAIQNAIRHHDDHGHRLALDGLYFFFLRTADYRSAKALAREPSHQSEDNCADGWRLGLSLHFAGQHTKAIDTLSASLSALEPGSRSDINEIGIDRRVLARCALCRSLWAQGAANEGLQEAQAVIDEAEALDYPVTLCIVLVWASQVFMWAGDLAAASRYVDQLTACGERYALNPYRRVGLGLRGAILTMSGQPDAGVPLLRESIDASLRAHHRLTLPILGGLLAESYAELDLGPAGLAIVDSTLARVREEQCSVYLPQLLLLKARLLHNTHLSRTCEAETLLEAAIRLARRHHAHTYERQILEGLADLRSGRKIGPVLYQRAPIAIRAPEHGGKKETILPNQLLNLSRSL
jgi:predicted ATPase/DNA-binding winged helix-turn-helix (wHTH) protein